MQNLGGSMAGKVVLVSGATGGIGQVTALQLAEMGARVVIIGRNPEKTAGVCDKIRAQTGNPGVDFLIADLSSQAEVHRAAEAFKRRYERLDVLVNNAGSFLMKREKSVDGIPYTWALNHFSYFLLTLLLLDRLKASAPARVINVSSVAHIGATIDFERLASGNTHGGYVAYSDTKLANVLFTYELARRLAGSGVTVNALHPGLVATNFGFRGAGAYAFFFWLLRPFSISPERGAKTSVYLASSPDVAGVTGKYFVKKRAELSSRASYDQDAARRLWEISEQMTGVRLGEDGFVEQWRNQAVKTGGAVCQKCRTIK